jgi:hypothetical protein
LQYAGGGDFEISARQIFISALPEGNSPDSAPHQIGERRGNESTSTN